MDNRQANSSLYDAMPKEWVPCEVCGSEKFRVLTKLDRYRMGVQTCQCETCDLTLTNPMPTEQALGDFYESRYRSYYRRVDKPSPELLKRLGIEERARHSAKFLNEASVLKPGARILDMGCADGSLLRAMQAVERGVQCFGVEPNPAYAQYAREHGVSHVWSSLDAVPTGEKFDLIVINHVLEHIRAPSAILRRLSEFLAPGALIYIDVPDASRYQSLDDLHIAHLYHFTKSSLERVAARANLVPRVLVPHSPPFHPTSLRGLFSVTDAASVSIEADPDGARVRECIARVERRAPVYFARHSWLGRLAVGVPKRIWRAVIS